MGRAPDSKPGITEFESLVPRHLAPEGKVEEPPDCNPGVSGFDARPVLHEEGRGLLDARLVPKTSPPQGRSFESITFLHTFFHLLLHLLDGLLLY